MADLTISVYIDAKGTDTGAKEAKSALKGITDEAGKVESRFKSIAGIDLKSLSNKLKSVGSAMRDFGGQLQSIGTQLALSITAPLVLAGKAILTAGGEYERALNIFQSVTKATAEEMTLAAQRAKELGADLTLPATSAKDAALAMNELGKAGLTASQAIDAAKGVLQLAAAGQLDEARAAEIAANALNAFRLEASETVRIANLLAAAANASSAGVDDIALAMQQASANFAAAKIPIEDLVTSISALANAGIKGSDAGTSLKTFIISLQAPSTKAAEAMQKLGINVFDAAGKMKDLPNIIGQFEKALAGLTDEQKVQALNQIFGSDAIRAAQILFATGTEGFAKLKEAVTANGAAAELANAQMKGLTGAWEGFKSQLETIGITLFEVVRQPLTNFLQTASNAAGQLSIWFEQLSPFMQQLIIAMAALAAAAGPVLIVIGGIVSAIGTLVTAIGAIIGSATAVGIALAAVVGIVVQFGPLLAVVAAEAYVLYQAWQTNFGGIRDFTAIVADAVETAWNAALTAINELTEKIMAEVAVFWSENGEDIMKVVNDVSDFIKSVWTDVVQFWRDNSETIKAIASAVWAVISTVIIGAIRNIANVIKLVLAVINGDWSKAWEATKALLQSIVNAWANIILKSHEALVNAVKLAFNAVWALNAELVAKAYKLGVDIVQGLINGIGSMFGPLGSIAARVVNSAIDRMRKEADVKSPSRVTFELGRFISEGLADGIKDGSAKVVVEAQSATRKALGEINRVVFNGDFRGFLESAFDIMADKGKSFGDKLKTIFGGIVSNFRTMLSRMLSDWLNAKIFGGSGSSSGGGGIFGGGTPPFNPSSSGGGATDSGTSGGGFSSFFGGGLRGTLTGIGAIGTTIGGAIGGRAGGLISSTATGLALGAQIGSIIPGIGTAIGAAVGAVGGFLVGIFGGDPKRKRDKKEKIPALNKGFTDALAQLRQLIVDTRTLRVSPDSALSRATELRAAIAGGFDIQFESKKYRKQAQTMIGAKLREADALIAELRTAAEIARAASERDRRILPEFARGVYLSPAFQAFRRQNGMLGGTWTGRDTIPAMLAHGEMVLNPYQQDRVRANAGHDVFKNAGIPGYAVGGVVQTPASQPVVMQDTAPVQVQISIQQDATGMFEITARSPQGRKVLLDVVGDGFANDNLKFKRR